MRGSVTVDRLLCRRRLTHLLLMKPSFRGELIGVFEVATTVISLDFVYRHWLNCENCAFYGFFYLAIELQLANAPDLYVKCPGQRLQ